VTNRGEKREKVVELLLTKKKDSRLFQEKPTGETGKASRCFCTMSHRPTPSGEKVYRNKTRKKKTNNPKRGTDREKYNHGRAVPSNKPTHLHRTGGKLESKGRGLSK